MKSISPIVGTILIIVITVSIAGLFYAFTSGMFNSIISSSNNLVNQQSKIISFTINSVYCSNNILYFDIYNKGNTPININNSQIIFTDNNGNTISINGNNIICNNGNIIPIGSNSLCYLINAFCYYNDTDYIKTTNFIYNGINYNYEILNNNKFMIYYSSSNSTSNTSVCQLPYLPLIIYNTQSISTPSPFQQDIAICNGSINIGNSFSYINNATLFNEINSNGSNIYFTTTCDSNPNIYSWYEGQFINESTYCDVWWINLSNGIPANSNVTIYMYVGNNSDNYYSQYYPYVGEAPQLSPTYGQYDNGNYVFNYYWNFNGTSIPPGWTQSLDSVSYNNGVTIYGSNSGYWYYTGKIFSGTILIEEMMKVIEQSSTTNYGEGAVGITTIPPSWPSTFSVTRVLEGNNPIIGYDFYGNGYITSIEFEPVGTFGIIGFYASSSGMAIYSNYQLIQQTSTYTVPSSYYIVGCNADINAEVFIQWLRIRAYPPNGVMPSIYIG